MGDADPPAIHAAVLKAHDLKKNGPTDLNKAQKAKVLLLTPAKWKIRLHQGLVLLMGQTICPSKNKIL